MKNGVRAPTAPPQKDASLLQVKTLLIDYVLPLHKLNLQSFQNREDIRPK